MRRDLVLRFSAARSLARWRGLKVYDGAICKRCGNPRRYVVNANCVDCDRAKHAANRENAALYQKARRKNRTRSAAERAKDCERAKRWRLKHGNRPDVVNATTARGQQRDAIRLNTLIVMREMGMRI